MALYPISYVHDIICWNYYIIFMNLTYEIIYITIYPISYVYDSMCQCWNYDIIMQQYDIIYMMSYPLYMISYVDSQLDTYVFIYMTS